MTHLVGIYISDIPIHSFFAGTFFAGTSLGDKMSDLSDVEAFSSTGTRCCQTTKRPFHKPWLVERPLSNARKKKKLEKSRNWPTEQHVTAGRCYACGSHHVPYVHLCVRVSTVCV